MTAHPLNIPYFIVGMIGERVRDKIAASKRKGIWVGGTAPIGYRSVDKKLEVVEEDAAKVRTIFQRYLALGSIGQLIEDLAMRGVGPRERKDGWHNGTTPRRFMMGPLAHVLKNRFYVGDVVYRDEVYQGQHAPILDRALFDAVQARLRERAVIRKLSRSRSLSLLAGLLFDDRGNHMSPSHANKRGVRYRYYVSQALLQHRRSEAGSISRVAALEIEELVSAAVRYHRKTAFPVTASPDSIPESASELSPRDFMALNVERIVVRARCIEVTLRQGPLNSTAPGSSGDDGSTLATISEGKVPDPGERRTINIPWSPTPAKARKGVAWAPSTGPNLDAQDRETLLAAIAKARSWMSDIVEGRAGSFHEIAEREGKVERHIRFLAPLAFLSPLIIESIVSGSASANLTVSGLARALPHSWTEQENKLGCCRTSRALPPLAPAASTSC